MRFSDELRRAAEPIWEAIFTHPLLQQIRDGSLPLDTFQPGRTFILNPFAAHDPPNIAGNQ